MDAKLLLKAVGAAAAALTAIVALAVYLSPNGGPASRAATASNGSVAVIGTAGNITINPSPVEAPLSPRARLAREGVEWSNDNFRKAIREGNRDDIMSFLQGGMKVTAKHSD
jgi:hypothetical protein